MMLKVLLALCGLLTLSKCADVSADYDFADMDESDYEALLRSEGFTEEEIQAILQVKNECCV